MMIRVRGKKVFVVLAILLCISPVVLAQGWRSVGTGDCPGRDVAGSRGPTPDPAKCDPNFTGYTAVCWNEGCTYKNLATGSCTGGANPGRMYTCAATVAPQNMGNWRSAGTGDCPGRDVAGSRGPTPDPAKCDPSFTGYTAVCWNEGCTYKNIATGSCTGGANPGRMYTCSATGTPSQPVSGRHYAMVNYAGDVRNPHDFIIDWANCRVSELNKEFSEGAEDIRISVCQPRSRLTMRTDFRTTGHWIQYDWVFLDDGTLVGGYYHDPGSYGPSVGKWVQ
jgi:hypothetical protein